MVSQPDHSPRSEYPGRVIIAGTDSEGRRVQGYALTGRSESSKRRVLVRDGDDVKCMSSADSTGENQFGVLHYTAMTDVNGTHVVTNGDQTDTIASGLRHGRSMEEALASRTFEPDTPHHTPRISAISTPDGAHTFSRIRRGPKGQRIYDEHTYPAENGTGHRLQTYQGRDESPLPPFTDDPHPIALDGSASEIAQTFWDSLPQNHRIAAAVKVVDPNGKVEISITNTKQPPATTSRRPH